LDEAQVREYTSKVNTLDKAGAYAIQELGEILISEISGSYSNVVGLPVEILREELEAWGKPRSFRKSPVFAAGR
jgi:septum formation protein